VASLLVAASADSLFDDFKIDSCWLENQMAVLREDQHEAFTIMSHK
jgi:hypothetical protein